MSGRLRMPWEIPGEDTKKAWELIRRKCVRWERRHAGKMRLALEEVDGPLFMVLVACMHVIK